MSDFDPADFVDDDFQARKTQSAAGAAPGQPARAPTREEVDSRVSDTQQKLIELKRAPEDLERERSALEETRRRPCQGCPGDRLNPRPKYRRPQAGRQGRAKEGNLACGYRKACI